MKIGDRPGQILFGGKGNTLEYKMQFYNISGVSMMASLKRRCYFLPQLTENKKVLSMGEEMMRNTNIIFSFFYNFANFS